jgi:hypothetical protein
LTFILVELEKKNPDRRRQCHGVFALYFGSPIKAHNPVLKAYKIY